MLQRFHSFKAWPARLALFALSNKRNNNQALGVLSSQPVEVASCRSGGLPRGVQHASCCSSLPPPLNAPLTGLPIYRPSAVCMCSWEDCDKQVYNLDKGNVALGVVTRPAAWAAVWWHEALEGQACGHATAISGIFGMYTV